MKRGPPFLMKYSFLIPCVATSLANVSNLCFMRADEAINGTSVFDEQGNVSMLNNCCIDGGDELVMAK